MLQNANFAFKFYASSFSVQSYGSFRFAIFTQISSFFKHFQQSKTTSNIIVLMRFWKKILLGVLLLSSFSVAFAASELPKPDDMGLPFESSVTSKDATYPIALIIRETIKYIGLFAILVISYGGILFLTSVGNDEKVKHAKQTIIYALVGVLLSVVAYTIVDIINSLKI